MRLLGPKSFPDLLKVFDEENSVKDARPPVVGDPWPRDRFKEANSQFGEWNEFELSHAELLDVKLHWNKEFGNVQEGMTVAEALQLQSVRSWIAEGKDKVFPESHIWLATEPLRNGCIEHRLLRNYEGRLVVLDGFHRLLAWAECGKQTTLAFIAGKHKEKSFMLEAIGGTSWDSETFDLRFATAKEAEEYAEYLNCRWNVSQAIRIQSSTDPVNCEFTGGLGARHLVRFEGGA